MPPFRSRLPRGMCRSMGLIVMVLAHSGLVAASTNVQPGHVAAKHSRERVSKATLLLVVRDFRDLLGADTNLYYLVTPPGGATEEERRDTETQIVRYLYRSSRDPSLDIPTRWIRDLREYELTAAEWTLIEKYFSAALAASTLPGSIRQSLNDRFTALRARVLSPA